MIFKIAMQTFDKKLRYYKKQYRYNSMNEIESCKTENPKQFWEYIKKLGPKKKRNIPLKVYAEDGCLTSCKQTVLNKWKNDFESLFKSNDSQTYDATFYKNDGGRLEIVSISVRGAKAVRVSTELRSVAGPRGLGSLAG